MSNIKYISTSALAKKLSITKVKLDKLLLLAKYIIKNDKGYALTTLGIEKSGKIQKSVRFGEYIVWDENIKIPNHSVKKEISDTIKEKKDNKDNKDNKVNFREKFIATHRTTDGHMVRSKSEMLIDNWLYMSEIVHAYEKKLPVEEELYCDFYIPTGKIYIEFWGLENEAKYLYRKKIKQDIYKKYNFNLIELNDNDVFNLDDILPKKLLEFGVKIY